MREASPADLGEEEKVRSKGEERLWREAYQAKVDALLHVTNDDPVHLAQRHIRDPPPRGGAGRVEHEQREDRLEAEADAEIMRQASTIPDSIRGLEIRNR